MFDNDGRSALHLAAECGSMEVDIITIIISIITIIIISIIIMLGDQCGSMEVETEFIIFNQNATFVHQVCKLLLNKNAFVNSKTKLGWTALHFAANKASNYFFLILFKNIKSTFNFPQGYTDLVEFLIKSGGTIGLKKKTTC